MSKATAYDKLCQLLSFEKAAYSIDDIGYQGKLDYQEHVDQPTPLLGNCWQAYEMPPPPANSSDEVRSELKEIMCLRDAAADELKAKVQQQDNSNPEQHFLELLEAAGTQVSPELRQLVDQAANELTTVSMHFKLLFNRPRPSQLFEVFEIEHNPFITTSGNSPAYPSGHAIIGQFIALMLSDLYPMYKPQLMQLGYEMGALRVVGGFHFRSDFTAGVDLADYLYDNWTCGKPDKPDAGMTVVVEEYTING
jgi:hypothetical protein